jgi:hypothetical protein
MQPGLPGCVTVCGQPAKAAQIAGVGERFYRYERHRVRTMVLHSLGRRGGRGSRNPPPGTPRRPLRQCCSTSVVPASASGGTARESSDCIGVRLPVWMRARWFRKHGYRPVERDGMAMLVWKPFVAGAEPPRWARPRRRVGVRRRPAAVFRAAALVPARPAHHRSGRAPARSVNPIAPLVRRLSRGGRGGTIAGCDSTGGHRC